MQRQITTNTFSKGMNLDLNPIMTPKDTLVGALNASYITYNGNEFILQNDMGNGRVESAYLPEGYIPVGIKEFGGIVYVASYNPEENKGQIGSFPSPERNISSNDFTTEATCKLSFEDFLESNTKEIIEVNGKPFVRGSLKTTVCKIQLVNNFNIRPGDEFNFYISGHGFEYLSNFFNVENGNIINPKNNLLTLQIAIQDEQGNLKDITKYLKRFNNQGEELERNDDNNININNGYFLFVGNELLQDNPQSDFYKNFTTNTNIYKDKLIGKLYLIATLNVIQQVSLEVSAHISEDKKRLEVKHTILEYYNCVDSNTTTVNNFITNDTIAQSTIDEPIKNYSFLKNNVIQNIHWTTLGIPTYTYSYDENTNLYCRKIVKTDVLSSGNSILDSVDTYTCSVSSRMAFQKEGEYLKNLTSSKTIILSKLGSGLIDINTWRYYITDNTLTINWGLNFYSENLDSVRKVVFTFYDAKTNNVDYIYDLSEKYKNNGVYINTVNFDNIKKNKIYIVELKAIVIDPITLAETERIYNYRWLFTTPIYNKYYTNGIISDFKELTTTNFAKENTLKLKGKINVPYNLNSNTQPLVTNVVSNNNVEILQGFINYAKIININYSSNLELENSKFYPFLFNKEGLEFNYHVDNPQNLIINCEPTYSGNYDTYSRFLPSYREEGYNPLILNHAIYSQDGNSATLNVNLYSELAGNVKVVHQNIRYLEPFVQATSNDPRVWKNIISEAYIKIGVAIDKSFIGSLKSSLYAVDGNIPLNGSTNIIKYNNNKKESLSINLNSILQTISNYIKNAGNTPVISFIESPQLNVDIASNNEDSFISTFDTDENNPYYSQIAIDNNRNSYIHKYFLILWYDGTNYVLINKLFYNDDLNTGYTYAINPKINLIGYLKDLYFWKDKTGYIDNKILSGDNDTYTYSNNYSAELKIPINLDVTNITQANFGNINNIINETLNNYSFFARKELLGSNENLFKITNTFNTSCEKNINLYGVPSAKAICNELIEQQFDEYITKVVINDEEYTLDSSGNSLNSESVYRITNSYKIVSPKNIVLSPYINISYIPSLKVGSTPNFDRTILVNNSNITTSYSKNVSVDVESHNKKIHSSVNIHKGAKIQNLDIKLDSYTAGTINVGDVDIILYSPKVYSISF